MAGHNKWSKIKRLKSVSDAKRGKLFTKLLREIQVASKIGGAEVRNNPRLRDAVNIARQQNVPKSNIEKAIQRGIGSDNNISYEHNLYEAFGPAGAAILIECLTDNKNRTVADIRAILTRNQGRFADAGSVSWLFDKVGVFMLPMHQVKSNEHILDAVFSYDCLDVQEEEAEVIVKVMPHQFEIVRTALENFPDLSFESKLTYIPQMEVPISLEQQEDLEKLLELLEDLDDVQEVFTNAALND